MSKKIFLLGIVLVGVWLTFFFSQKNGDAPSLQQPNYLASETERITDKADFFSIDIPRDWAITYFATEGARVSGIRAESPDFNAHTDHQAVKTSRPTHYTAGAEIEVSVFDFAQPYPIDPAIIRAERSLTVAGVPATIATIQPPTLLEGTLINARFVHQNKSYLIRVAYNPAAMSAMETFIERTIQSLSFVP